MRISELFDNGQFVVTAEVGPPKGIDASHVVTEAKEYLSGITAVNVTDNQSSVMRMGSLPACVMLKNAGLTPILQLTCRDRNRIALQSELLGAAALGIDNILCLTGDHTKMGDHPGAKPVFDLDSVSLLYTASQLEKGYDLAGNELVGEPPKFAKGAVVSPISDSLDAQLAKSYCGKGNYADLEIIDALSSDVEFYAIGFKKGSDLTAQVNAQLVKLAEDGTIAALAEKYGVANTAITDFSSQK